MLLARVVAVGSFVIALSEAARWWSRIGTPTVLAHDWMSRAFADAALWALFAAHHSVWPRAPFKTRLERALGSAERPAYVVLASGLLWAFAHWWQPLGGSCYELAGAWRWVALGAQAAGAALLLGAAIATDGLALIGWHLPATKGGISARGPYRHVRHPLYTGLLLCLLATPNMTPDRALFTVLALAYVVLAIPFEERTLQAQHGSAYGAYCSSVRWRLAPRLY